MLQKFLAILFVSLLLLVSFHSHAQVGSAYQLSGDLVSDGDVVSNSTQISNDSQWVVYLADQDVNDVFELYSVPIKGGRPIKLNGSLTKLTIGGQIPIYHGDVINFKISDDSQTVIYLADQDNDEVDELYSVPIGGGEAVKINRGLVEGGDVYDYQISADSQWVIYKADPTVNQTYGLYRVSITGGSHRSLESTIQLDETNFVISADSQFVVYRDLDNIYSVSINGGGSIRLNGDLVANGFVSSYRISPDGQRVVYSSSEFIAGRFELYSVPIAGGVPIKLNSHLVTFGDVNYFQISNDSQYVVYYADAISDGDNELYSVPIMGGEVQILSFLFAFGPVTSFKLILSPNSQHVIYIVGGPRDGVRFDYRIYSVPISGGVTRKLDVNDSGLDAAVVSADSQWLIYAKRVTNNVKDIYSVPITGGEPVKLYNANLVQDYAISPDSQSVLYATRYRDVDVRLQTVPIMGGDAIVLNNGLPVSTVINNIMFSPNSEFVVYRANPNMSEEYELFAHRLKEEEQFCLPIKAKNGSIAVICL